MLPRLMLLQWRLSIYLYLVCCRSRSWNSCTVTTWALKKYDYLQENQYTVSTWMLTLSIHWADCQGSRCLEYQCLQPCQTTLYYTIPCKPCEVVETDIFIVSNKNLLHIVDYCSKFPVVKNVSFSANDPVHAAQKTFAMFRLPWELISDVGTNFASETFKELYRKLNIQQSKMSSYHHQSSGQGEVCIKFMKYTIKKCFDTKKDINLALLQIWSISVGAVLASPDTILFNRPAQCLLPQISRALINIDNNNVHFEALWVCQIKYSKNSDTPKKSCLLCRVYSSCPVRG